MNKREKKVVSQIDADLYFLRLAIEKDDPKDELLLRVKDLNEKSGALREEKV